MVDVVVAVAIADFEVAVAAAPSVVVAVPFVVVLFALIGVAAVPFVVVAPRPIYSVYTKGHFSPFPDPLHVTSPPRKISLIYYTVLNQLS